MPSRPLFIPEIPVSIQQKLQLKKVDNFFGISKRFGIKIYEYKNGIFCGMMDETGGPALDITFVRKNNQKFVKMDYRFVETAAIEVIEKLLADHLPTIHTVNMNVN